MLVYIGPLADLGCTGSPSVVTASVCDNYLRRYYDHMLSSELELQRCSPWIVETTSLLSRHVQGLSRSIAIYRSEIVT